MPLPAGTVAWIDVTDPSANQIAEITGLLGLHELIAEDILEGNQRAKIEVTADRIHIVMFALVYGARSSRARSTSSSAMVSCSPRTRRCGTRG